MSIVTQPSVIDNPVAGGVDTHADVHVAAVIDHVGRELGHRSFATTAAGYVELACWLTSHGTVTVVGVEGTGVYGAGLTRIPHRRRSPRRGGRPPGPQSTAFRWQVRPTRRVRSSTRCAVGASNRSPEIA